MFDHNTRHFWAGWCVFAKGLILAGNHIKYDTDRQAKINEINNSKISRRGEQTCIILLLLVSISGNYPMPSIQ